MSNKKILNIDCVKLLYIYCWIDCGNVLMAGLVTAGLFFTGDVFCTNPFWTFAPGCMGICFWSSTCVLCISLAVSRCLAFHQKEIAKFAYLVLFLTGCHAFFMTFFTRNTIFNATLGSWFYIPFIQPFEEELPKYQNSYHLLENFVTAILTPLLYAYLCVQMLLKRAKQTNTSNTFKKMQKSVFLQSLVVCSLTSVTSVIFAYMQLFPCPSWWPFMAEVAYTLCGTVPAAAILLLNQTIKQRAKMLLGIQKNAHISSGTDGPTSKTAMSSGNNNRSKVQPTTDS